MTVTHSGTGTPTSATGSASSLTPAYPATVNAGEKAVICVNVKPFSATITTPSGFQLVPGATNPATNGSTASGTNTGSTKVAWYESISPCAGTEGGTTVTITVTSADSAGAVIHTAATSLGAWDTSVFASGNKVGNTANMSAASGTQTSVAAGDMFYIGFGINASLGTPTTDTLTQTGVTYGTVTNRSDRAITTGNDTRNRVNSVPVTSVTTPSGGATAGYTNASSTSGTVGFLRLRDVASTITGTGAATSPVATSSGTGTLNLTGAGSGTSPAATSGGQGTLSLTGAGTGTSPPSTSVGAATLTLTGAGTTTAPPATSSATGTLALTGAGATTTPPGTSQGAGTLTLTGSGTSQAPAATSAGEGGAVGETITGTGAATAAAATTQGLGTLTILGAGASTAPPAISQGIDLVVITPAERIYLIGADNRTYDIEADDRTHTVPADDRTHVIPADDRTSTIPAENRTAT